MSRIRFHVSDDTLYFDTPVSAQAKINLQSNLPGVFRPADTSMDDRHMWRSLSTTMRSRIGQHDDPLIGMHPNCDGAIITIRCVKLALSEPKLFFFFDTNEWDMQSCGTPIHTASFRGDLLKHLSSAIGFQPEFFSPSLDQSSHCFHFDISEDDAVKWLDLLGEFP